MKKSFLVLGLGFLLMTVGCGKISSEKTPSPQNPVAVAPMAEQVPSAANNSGVLARLNGQPITDAEVTERIKDRLQKIDSQIYEIKKSGLDDMVEEKLLESTATKRKVSVDDLIRAEVDGKIGEPSQSETEAFYNMYKARLNNQPLASVKEELIKQIKLQKRGSIYNGFISDLKKQAKLEIYMKRPRINVATDGDPAKGNPKAPITLIEFSDFQCPFCKRGRLVIQQILDTYKDKIYYVFRDFPLSFHKQAKKAAMAAECAGDQNKYWPYSAVLWEKQGDFEPEKLKQYAKDLGLNTKKFNDCLDTDKFSNEIDKDQQDGMQVGVSGTPAYFINGIMLSGAQPLEKFQEVIDEELQENGK